MRVRGAGLAVLILCLPALVGWLAAGNGGGAARPGTAAGANAAPTGVVVIGDFGDGGKAEWRVSKRIRRFTGRHPFAALGTVGDMIYPDGDPDDFDADWREPYGWFRKTGLPVVAALGNHDVYTDRRAVMDLFGMPHRWYTRRVGHLRFFVLDANDPWNERQREWLRSKLRRFQDRPIWKVVLLHQAPYSCGPHGGDEGVRRAWKWQFVHRGVDLVLAGHDHLYERFAPRNGVTYVVDGIGGAGLYPLGRCPAAWDLEVGDDDHHGFVYLRATRSKLTIRAVSARGATLDSVAL